MSVTNYIPSECSYSFTKLKDVVYVVSKEHVKDVHVDNGIAYINNLTELPLRLNGFNIQFTEETSLDERYKFSKKVTLSLKGYTNINFFGERYYVIVETIDGQYYMVNVDYPSRITHTFNLSQNINQTDFTFACESNFPTLRLMSNFEAVEPPCIGYNVHGISTLELIEKEKAVINTENKEVITYGDSFKTVKFLGNSCTLQEVYNGNEVTDTITFDIAFGNYKPSWHYNLLEFLQNKYAAIITPKSNDNKYYIGFNFGLVPSYTIQTSTNVGESDIITVTLTETSIRGLVAANDYSEDERTDTRWIYVTHVGDTICYECIGMGLARYLVQQEVDELGNPTSQYKVLEGYESLYPNLNIIDTFSTTEEFPWSDCTHYDVCTLATNIPQTILFDNTSCKEFSVRSDCDWEITDIPQYITATPSSGNANTDYTVSICNTLNPSSSQVQGSFNIHYGDNVRVVNTVVQLSDSFIHPTRIITDCNVTTAKFTYTSPCLQVTSISSLLTYQISSSQLTVQMPPNTSTESRATWDITVTDCSGNSKNVSIVQDQVYEEWRDNGGITCEDGDSYHLLEQYTGTTPITITTPTGITRKGTLIQSGDTRCSSVITKFEFVGNYYCQNGNKFEAEEEFESFDNGATWHKTGTTRLGSLVEEQSEWCSETPTYTWVLTQKFQCGE